MARPTEPRGLAPGTPLAQAGPRLVRARLGDVRRHERALSRRTGEPDPEAVHDLRVATRRLRAALALLGRGALARLEDEVAALGRALGAVRDRQVQRAWFAERAAAGSAPAGALARHAGVGLPAATARLRRALGAFRGRIAPAIERAAPAAGTSGRLGGHRIAEELRRRLRTLERRLAAARRDPSPETTHRLRIAAKKLRYVAELAAPGFPGAAKAMLQALVPLQERLGELHDADVRRARLGEHARTGAPRERRAAEALLGPLRAERAGEEAALLAELGRWRAARRVRALRRRLAAEGRRRARDR